MPRHQGGRGRQPRRHRRPLLARRRPQGRGLHSSTSQLNQSRWRSTNPRNTSTHGHTYHVPTLCRGLHSFTSQLNLSTRRSNKPRNTSTHHRLITCQHSAGAYTRPLLSSTEALGGPITQETRRLTIDLSRANTLQGLTLVHFSARPEPS